MRLIGVEIPMTGDDANAGPFPIGFPFPFYGDTFSTFRVGSNGFVSFTSGVSTFTNQALPNSSLGVPENLLAVFWDDLNFGSIPHVHYHSDNTRLVIQYQDVTRLGDPGNPNTFEVILEPDGTIIYQYLSITAQVANSNTVGIQNQARNDGLQVVFNAAYLQSSLAVRFRPPLQWLTLSPISGSVAAGLLDSLSVGFDAEGLPDGVYTGMIRVTGNDAAQTEHLVLCVLTVTSASWVPAPVPEIQMSAETLSAALAPALGGPLAARHGADRGRQARPRAVAEHYLR